jgi:hypothetical protein
MKLTRLRKLFLTPILVAKRKLNGGYILEKKKGKAIPVTGCGGP